MDNGLRIMVRRNPVEKLPKWLEQWWAMLDKDIEEITFRKFSAFNKKLRELSDGKT